MIGSFFFFFFWVQKIFCFLFDFSLDNFSGIHKSSIGCADAGGGSIHIYIYFLQIYMPIFLFILFHFCLFHIAYTFVKSFFRSDWHISNWKLMKCVYIYRKCFFFHSHSGVYASLQWKCRKSCHIRLKWRERREKSKHFHIRIKFPWFIYSGKKQKRKNEMKKGSMNRGYIGCS